MTLDSNNPIYRFILLGALMLLSGCSGLSYVDAPSANQNGRINHLVLHFTSADFGESLSALTEPSDRPVSAHYLIPKQDDASYPMAKGKIHRLVNENQRAWHAGFSYWDDEAALNNRSIGIELVNTSHCAAEEVASGVLADLETICEFEHYPELQITLLTKLAQDIIRRHPDVDALRILGHADIAPQRKVDPGPLFPWYRLYQAGVGAWPLTADQAEFVKALEAAPNLVHLMQSALAAIGYNIEVTGVQDFQSQRVVRAFQMHFRPENYRGLIDIESTAIALALIKRYRYDRLAALILSLRDPAITGDDQRLELD